MEEVVPDKSSQAAGQVFEPDRPHKSSHVLGRRLKTKALVTGLKAATEPDMPSKPVWGRELLGGFDSRPPPPLKLSSDQRLCAKTRAIRRRRGARLSPTDRCHHTSLSGFGSACTGQVFRPTVTTLDKSSRPPPTKEVRTWHRPIPRGQSHSGSDTTAPIIRRQAAVS
jgi:hypothetical protein